MDARAARLFADRLRLVMTTYEIPVVEVAAACGANPSTVSQWLGGRRAAPEGRKLLRLLASPLLREHLVSVEWLATGRGAMHRPPDLSAADAYRAGQRDILRQIGEQLAQTKRTV